MAKAASRKARSRETEKTVALYLKEHLFPEAVAVPSALSGKDILNTPGLAVEVKSRRDLNLTAWLRQARKNAGQDIPAVIHRPDGFGVTTVCDWPVTLTLHDFVDLLKRAGVEGVEQ